MSNRRKPPFETKKLSALLSNRPAAPRPHAVVVGVKAVKERTDVALAARRRKLPIGNLICKLRCVNYPPRERLGQLPSLFAVFLERLEVVALAP